jgi:mannosyl-3-phosphoglycerate phosphatase family protein
MPALKRVRREGIPLVLCSSKTRAEIERWRERLDNRHPFISENGGGVFVPPSYFSADDLDDVWPGAEMTEGYYALVLGTPYPLLRRALEEIRKEGFEVEGFGDMDVARVAKVTGLTPEEAKLALHRDFDEPFMFHGKEAELSAFLASVERKGLRHTTGGRLHHLTGENDKGKAVEVLKRLYERKFDRITTIALGDSLNDLPMLGTVDYPILVQNHRGEHDSRVAVPNLIKAEGAGPQGWARAVLDVMGVGKNRRPTSRRI